MPRPKSIKEWAQLFAKAYARRLKVSQEEAEIRIYLLLLLASISVPIGKSVDLLKGSATGARGQLLITRTSRDLLLIEWKERLCPSRARITGSVKHHSGKARHLPKLNRRK